MASRSEKLRRRQRRKEKKRRRTPSLAPAAFERPRGLVLIEPPGVEKMSEALASLVEPELDTAPNPTDLHDLLACGVMAWNAALLKGTEREQYLEELTQKMSSKERQDFYEQIQPLIRRKEKLFPHNHRPIIDFELTWLAPDKPHVKVLSGIA